jgi:hypothetical protein
LYAKVLAAATFHENLLKMNAQLEEAKGYVDNAREILKEKAGKKDNHYADKKYVRMAGDTAYKGVLEAVDTIVTPLPKQRRKSVEYYQAELAKRDKKLLQLYNDAYNILHLSVGYDGILNANVVKEGLNVAEEIINRVGKYVA